MSQDWANIETHFGLKWPFSSVLPLFALFVASFTIIIRGGGEGAGSRSRPPRRPLCHPVTTLRRQPLKDFPSELLRKAFTPYLARVDARKSRRLQEPFLRMRPLTLFSRQSYFDSSQQLRGPQLRIDMNVHYTSPQHLSECGCAVFLSQE